MRGMTRRYKGNAKPPYLFFLLTVGAWQMDRESGWSLWQALSKSRFSRPSEMRQKILLWRGHFEAVPTWMCRALKPQEVIATIEDLVVEGLLLRLDASRIEESIFRCMNAQGEWK